MNMLNMSTNVTLREVYVNFTCKRNYIRGYIVDYQDDRTLRKNNPIFLKRQKYAIFGDIVTKLNMLYSSPLFEIIDDGTADLICRSDIYLANEIISMNNISRL